VRPERRSTSGITRSRSLHRRKIRRVVIRRGSARLPTPDRPAIGLALSYRRRSAIRDEA